MQYITRKGSIDSGHRIMNESQQCFNLHGHTYLYELHFSFPSIEAIGYKIDFKEIKRVGVQWLEDKLDHAMILNPCDTDVIQVTEKLKSKIWLMSLNGQSTYCNPSVENISKEIFLAMEILFQNWSHLNIHQIRLYETPNCYTDCYKNSISDEERHHFIQIRKRELEEYAKLKGKVEYDDRLINFASGQ